MTGGTRYEATPKKITIYKDTADPEYCCPWIVHCLGHHGRHDCNLSDHATWDEARDEAVQHLRTHGVNL